MTKFISRFAKDESGATAIEYGLIAALVAVVLITALTTLERQPSARPLDERFDLARARPGQVRLESES
jgi:pilus assembly protein Flp/PilA